MLTAIPLMILLPLGLLTSGCEPEENNNDEFLKELTRKQAAQHDALLRQSENLSKASRQLVEADANARNELTEMQSRLQQEFEAERRNIDGQRDKLDDERRDIADQRHRDPLIATAILQGTTLLIAALPFVLLLYLMRAARDDPTDAALAELLVHEFSADEPLLLPHSTHASARLEHDSAEPDASPVTPDDLQSDPPAIN